MKSIFFIFCLLISITTISQSNWEMVNVPDSISARSIYFNDDDIYLGTNGGIYHSNDNCETWEYLGLENYIIRTILITSDNHLIVGGTGKIFKYLDVNDWQVLFVHNDNIICLMESSHGYLFFSSWGNIYRSTNSGETWNMVMETLNSEVINDIDENTDGILFAGSTSYIGGNTPGGIYRSLDNGENWDLIGLDYHFVSSLEINSYDTIYAGTRGHWSSGGGGVFKSLDETGNLWQCVYENNLITSMCINEFNTLIIGCSTLDGAPGGIFQSFDNGQSWIDITPSFTGRYFEEVEFNNQNHLYAISYHLYGDLFRTINPITGLQKVNITNEEFKIFPNPAMEKINIELQSGKSYLINITDMNGRSWLKLETGFVHDKDFTLDINNLVSGMYLLNIIFNNEIFTYKLIKY